MNKIIVFKNDQNDLCFVSPAPNDRRIGESYEDFLTRTAKCSVPPIVRYESTGETDTDPDTREIYQVKRQIIEERPFEVMNDSDIPKDRIFRSAFRMNKNKISINVAKAKTIAHDIRRAKRKVELAPFDDLIAKQIPGNEGAEAQRVLIREKYDTIQIAIDNAKTIDDIKLALG